MKKFLLFLLFSISGFMSFADHTKGGWIYYEYVGPGSGTNTARYNIVVYVYMIRQPNPGQLDQQINLTIYNGPQNLQFYQTVSASLADTTIVQNCQCNPCIVNSPLIDYNYARYTTTVELPVAADGYTLAYQRCCRIINIANIISPSSDYGDTWTIRIPGTTGSATAPQNSSPRFIKNDTAVICANSFFRFDFTATDPDGDSLTYEFAPAFIGASRGAPNPGVASAPNTYTSVPYALPFSATEPLGSKVSIDFRTGVVSGIAPPIGEYVLTALVKEYRSGQYIAESRKSLHIKVASCNLVAAQLDDDKKCDGFTKTFKNNLPDAPGATYSWDFGVPGITTDVSTALNPTYTYSDTGTYKVTLAISMNGVCNDTATATVKVYPVLTPDFINTGQCKNTAIQFSDKSQTTYGSTSFWTWNFGDGLTSGQKNPAHTFTSAGNYNVTLTVSNNKGCENSITKTITVKDQPDLSATNDTLICSIDTLQLNAVGAGTFAWTPNYNINNLSSSSPLVSPDVPTKYFVTLTDPFGCKATDSVFVDVKLFVTIDAGKDTGICAGDNITLNPISDALHYNWSPASSLSDPLIKYPVASPTVTTKYYVIGNIGKCQSTDSVIVRVAPYPGAAGIPDTTICFGSALQLYASGGTIFSWTPAFYLNNPNISNPVAKPDHSIKYVVMIRDTLGCPKAAFDTVLVTVQKISVDAGPTDTSIVLNQPLQLNATGGQNYNWTPATGLNNPLIANPVASLTDDIRYTVTGSTSAGCTSSDTIHVHVFKVVPGIYVPTAFTPNGDGLNDLFRPVPIGIKKINHFKVFNRWGVLMYSSDNVHYEAGAGWDGTYKGKPQDTAVFVWIVEGVDFLDNKITQKGTVTLIR